MRLPLLGGAYSTRSVIASAQRCVNLFPEINPKESPVPVTHYQRPGLVELAAGEAKTVRGVYRASNGNGYCVIGQSVYAVSSAWALTLLGTLTTVASTPVSMIDNGITILLVDNSPYGYTITLADNTFAQIVDPTGSFTGATRVDTIDTFVLWNKPGTTQFGSTLSNQITPFDALYFASKSDYPDPLQTLIVNRHEILLIGALKSEIWYDAGGATFPFAELPGAYIEHGTCAPYSVASEDINVYWLHQDLQGQGMVLRQRGYETKRVSNHALEYQIQQMVAAGHTIADAIGYTYQQGGHVFYVLTFPTGDQTWVYDAATEEWHQRAWTDANGNLHRDRTNCAANLYGKNVVGDWQNGKLYALDQDTYTDNGDPISCIRSFPHLDTGLLPNGQLSEGDGRRIQASRFQADMDTGNAPLDSNGNAPKVTLRWSLDRGHTFGQGVLQEAGAPGQFATWPQWLQQGIGRDFVFELSYSIAGKAALNGAWIDAKVLNT